jgi:hypothetical protein
MKTVPSAESASFEANARVGAIPATASPMAAKDDRRRRILLIAFLDVP